MVKINQTVLYLLNVDHPTGKQTKLVDRKVGLRRSCYAVLCMGSEGKNSYQTLLASLLGIKTELSLLTLCFPSKKGWAIVSAC